MAKRVLRWGLLSTANINKRLIGPINASKRNELLAVASRSKDKAEAYAQEHKIDRSYGSYEDMLLDPWVDVIYNPLPNHLHAEWTIKAVEAGKHVLCEKPMALNLEEMDAIISAARKHEKVVSEAFMYRSHPQTLKIKEIIENGVLGKIRLIRGSYTYVMWNDDDIRMKPQMGGGGLWDIGCYPLSYARAVLGTEPLEVFGWQTTGKTGVDEAFVAQLRFPEDVYAQIDCSMRLPYHTFVEIIGDKATLNIPHPYNPEASERLYLSVDGKIDPIKFKGPDTYISEVEDMADAICDGKTPRVTLADSRANTAAIMALFESARTGKPVTVADLG
jgi:D-xylose 1-dehydrogenase (NADP+, D-xylono-1,5-lactone-forming)